MASLSPALRQQREALIVKLSPGLREHVRSQPAERIDTAVSHSLIVANRLPEWWLCNYPEGTPVSTRIWLYPRTIEQIERHVKRLRIPKRRVLEALLLLAITDEQNVLHRPASAA